MRREPVVPRVTFLTRRGCPKSPAMYSNLVAALGQRGWSIQPTTIDIGELAPSDVHTGYGTPTVLVDNADLFGLQTPELAAPT